MLLINIEKLEILTEFFICFCNLLVVILNKLFNYISFLFLKKFVFIKNKCFISSKTNSKSIKINKDFNY